MAEDEDDGDEDRKKLQGFDGIYFRFRGFEFAIGGTFIVYDRGSDPHSRSGPIALLPEL